MGNERQLPLAYRVVAWLFVLSGAGWFLSAFNGFFPPIAFAMALVCVVTGIGLFCRKHSLWTVALVLVWLEIVGLVVLLAIESLGLLAAQEYLALAGRAAVLGVKLAVSVWAYRVLIREDVCACYYDPEGTR